jgi:hypothetical protein
MVAKLTRLTHRIVIQLHLVTAVPFAVLAPHSQSGNFWIHPCILCSCLRNTVLQQLHTCHCPNISWAATIYSKALEPLRLYTQSFIHRRKCKTQKVNKEAPQYHAWQVASAQVTDVLGYYHEGAPSLWLPTFWDASGAVPTVEGMHPLVHLFIGCSTLRNKLMGTVVCQSKTISTLPSLLSDTAGTSWFLAIMMTTTGGIFNYFRDFTRKTSFKENDYGQSDRFNSWRGEGRQ